MQRAAFQHPARGVEHGPGEVESLVAAGQERVGFASILEFLMIEVAVVEAGRIDLGGLVNTKGYRLRARSTHKAARRAVRVVVIGGAVAGLSGAIVFIGIGLEVDPAQSIVRR